MELRELTAQLEEMMQKAKKKKQPAAGTTTPHLGEDGAIKSKEKELVNSQVKIGKLKGEIGLMRRQLEGVFNLDHIVKLEDELKDKTRILRELESEHEALLKVSREQSKAYKILSKEDDYQRSIEKLSDELREAKQKLKKLQIQKKEEEKALKEQHNRLIGLEEKNRRLYQLTEEKKKHKEARLQSILPDNIGDEDVKDLEERIKYAEQDKLDRERELRKEVAKQEQSIQQLNYEIKKCEIEKKERDQEWRLNELKIRELRRQIPQSKTAARSASRGGSLGKEKLLPIKEGDYYSMRPGANSSTPKGRLIHKRNGTKPSVFFKNNCTPSAEQLMNQPRMERGEEKEKNGTGTSKEELQNEEHTQSSGENEVDTREDSKTENERMEEKSTTDRGERVETGEKKKVYEKGF